MAARKKILVTGLTDNHGGVEQNVYNLVSRLSTDIQFDFWCSNSHCAFEDELTDLGCNVFHGAKYGQNAFQAFSDTHMFFSTHSHEYDALWSNKSMLVNIDDVISAQKYGIRRIILHARNPKNMFPGISGQLKGALHQLNKPVANRISTDYWACSLVAGAYFFNNRNLHSSLFHVIPNAVDIDKLTYDPALRQHKRSELNIADNSIVIGFVGRLQYQKDPEHLIRIFATFTSQNPDSKLLVVGDGELRSSCQILARRLEIENKVIFLGPRRDVAELYQAMDAFCLPSRFEGLGNVVIEAQAAGLPCVISDTIPSEARITNLCTVIHRTDSECVWADALDTALRNNDRMNMSSEICRADFEINTASQNIATLLTTATR